MLQLVITGRVWKFGDDMDTDVIAPGKYLALPLDQLKNHAMEPLDPEFHKRVKPGDIMVAGRNFGCGSSREQAPVVLKTLGVSAILAESFARIFFRNAVSIGLPLLPCKGISEAVNQGDLLEVNFETGQAKNLATGCVFVTKPLSSQMVEILKAGGAISLLKKRLEKY